MEKLRQRIAELTAALSRLSPRERIMVLSTSAAAVVFVLLLVGLGVGRSASGRLKRIESKSAQLKTVAELTVTFKSAEQERQALERRLRGNTVRLFSFVEELAKKSSLEIGSMTDKGQHPAGDTKITEASVEVTFTRVTLDKLVKFMGDAEASQGIVKIKKLQLRPRSDESVIDAWVVLSTYQLGT